MTLKKNLEFAHLKVQGSEKEGFQEQCVYPEEDSMGQGCRERRVSTQGLQGSQEPHCGDENRITKWTDLFPVLPPCPYYWDTKARPWGTDPLKGSLEFRKI